MVLTFDVGNSNIVIGGHRHGGAEFVARMATDQRLEADQYAVQLGGIFELYGVRREKIEGIAIASVVPGVTGSLRRALRHFSDTPPLVLSLANAGDIDIAIDHPAELGMDILASAIEVKATHPLPAVIVDMGTATKLTALDKNGRLLGVSIAPGLYLSLNALVKNASLLRGISMEAPQNAIGRNTPESMKSGVVLGAAAMLDGMIDRFAEELGDIKTLIATGGAAQVVVPHCRHKIEYNDTLLLDGLYKAFKARQAAE